jgi:hypothetical protein
MPNPDRVRLQRHNNLLRGSTACTFTRAALSTGERAKGKFLLSVISVRTTRPIGDELTNERNMPK